MRVLIVGCGYVGLPLGRELHGAGHEVVGLRRSREADPALRAAGIAPFHADITDPHTLADLPGAFDWVIHCPAAGGGGADAYRRVYVEGTRNLLDQVRLQGPRTCVYTGSTSVYGQDDGSWVTEKSPTEPSAETARLLLETERVLAEAGQASGLCAIRLRLAGIYGPGRGYWFKQFLGGRATVDGKGRRFLNMIHQQDVVGAIRAALERGRPGEVYNVVDDEPVSQNDLFRWLSETTGRPMPPTTGESVSPRRRGATNKRVSNRRLKTELAYTPRYPTFREGFATVTNGAP